MSDNQSDKARDAAERILALVEEVEASGDATLGGDRLERARAILHAWIDTVTAVVAVPAFGRVTLIHGDGKQSTISSSDLPFAVSAPVDWNERG
jgi:hypothetical protein